MSKASTSAAAGIPPLSDITLAEFECNTTGDIWNELLVLARQPGVVNLGQGFPDYDGSKAAREAAADAMVDPTKVRECPYDCVFMTNFSRVLVVETASILNEYTYMLRNDRAVRNMRTASGRCSERAREAE